MTKYEDLTFEDKQVALDEANEIMNKKESAWVLQYKFSDVPVYYTEDENEEYNYTKDLQKAELFECKNKEIEFMKNHEKVMREEYGEDAICDYGYTNMMKSFDFVEVELEDSK